MKKYIFLTNIPTPYRTSFYNQLFDHDFNFEVYYMRNNEDDRSWEMPLEDLDHPFYIDKGFYKMFGRYHLHFNPKLILKLIQKKNVDIIIGGGWNDVNVLVLAILKRMGLINNALHFWTEANYLTIGASKDNFLKKITRKFVYNSSRGVQLSSGIMTQMTLEKWGIKSEAYIPLPNTIQEEEFQISETEVDSRYNKTKPIFIMPVRLTEQIKGIINFFTAIRPENIKKGRFLIAGDGPDKLLIAQYISSNGLEGHIELLGHCNIEDLVRVYKSANVFILPSFTDASPLTLVEALRMKLPLLVSDRCGNHYEAVREEENGFLFDPYNHSSIKLAFESILNRFNDWRAMGEISGNIYNKMFLKKTVIDNFINGFVDYSNSKK